MKNGKAKNRAVNVRRRKSRRHENRKACHKAVLPVICERIRHYRDRMGMEQLKLADLVGVTANSVSNWENGRSRRMSISFPEFVTP